MASKVSIFCAGVLTTFAVISVGFGGGVLVAQSALKGPPAQSRVSPEPDPSLRVVVRPPLKTFFQPTADRELVMPEPVPVVAKEPAKDDQGRFQALRAEV